MILWYYTFIFKTIMDDDNDRMYAVSYVNADGERVDEMIAAPNHKAALRIARKRGMQFLINVERKMDGYNATSRRNRRFLSRYVLPIVLAAVAALLTALYWLYKSRVLKW